MPVSGYNGMDRRSGKDRRQRNSPWYGLFFTGGNRTRVRRKEDRKRAVWMDRYGSRLFTVIMLIIVLSLLDALLTLILVNQHGAREVNPVMSMYLKMGAQTFILAKYLLTVLPILILLFYKEAIAQRFYGERFLFALVVSAFGSVVLWETYLLVIIS